MTQQIINVGTAPNDGLGDPIRTAFIKTNNNFSQLFGATLPNNIVNGTSTVSINTANGNVSFNVANVSNVMVVTANSVGIAGNLSANYFVGNGAGLTGVVAASSYGNANVEVYLPTYSGNLAALTGNVTTTANIAGAYILGDGSQLTNLPPGNYSNANVSAYLPTYSGNLVALTGNITTTANITGSYILGNGSQLTGLPAVYSNADVASYLPTYSGAIANLTVTGNLTAATQGNSDSSNLVATTQFVQNIVTTSGGYGNVQVAGYLPTYTGNLTALTGAVTTTANVSGNYILGNGSTLSSITGANVTGTVASATSATTVTSNAQANITSVGTLTSLNVGGNTFVSGGFFRLPSYSTAQIAALTGMVGGELVYNADLSAIQGYQINPATSTMGWVGWTVATYQ